MPAPAFASSASRSWRSAFGDGKGKVSILISHTHWDHVQGLPFFSPLYRAGNQIDIFARQRDMHLEAVFSQQHHAPYFPVPLSRLHADMHFHELIEGARFEIGDAKITCARLNHPWVAIAYRIDVDRRGGRLLRRHRAVQRSVARPRLRRDAEPGHAAAARARRARA